MFKKSKKFLIPLLIGIIIRIFLMTFTYHPDFAGQNLSAYFWGFKNVTNVYEHIQSLPPTDPLVKNFGVDDIFIYPPLTYFTLGTFQKVFAFTGLGHFLEDIMAGINIYKITGLTFYLFIIKLPYLFFDLAVAYFLYKYFDDPRQKYLAFIFWIFNPVTLYATFCMGVFDIIPVFFTVLAAYFLKKQRLFLSVLAVGFGAAFKMYPIFLLPFIVFKSDKWLQRIKLSIVGLLPLILTNLPFVLSSAYRSMVFSGKNSKMLYMQWMLSGAEGLFPFLLILTFIYLLSQNKSLRPKFYVSYFFVFFLLLFSVTHFHPQWFIWISPFLIIEIINYKFKEAWAYLALMLIYIFIIFTFENSLSVGLFAPLNPDLASFVGTQSILTKATDINQLKSYFRSIFAGISVYLAFTHLKKSA
ncbi:MAG TPA: hypothetical protein PK257_01060 [Candidatus Woesebacteria bacterium]|nr:hypothetical protein [Candidatus Woesebacteria bacterium]